MRNISVSSKYRLLGYIGRGTDCLPLASTGIGWTFLLIAVPGFLRFGFTGASPLPSWAWVFAENSNTQTVTMHVNFVLNNVEPGIQVVVIKNPNISAIIIFLE